MSKELSFKKAASAVIVSVVAALVILPLFSAFMSPAKPPPTRSILDSASTPMDKIKMEYEQLDLGGLLWKANLTIDNASEYTLQDIEIYCTQYGNSGTAISHKKMIVYERIAPQQKRAVKNFDVGILDSQTKSTDCMILQPNLAQDGYTKK